MGFFDLFKKKKDNTSPAEQAVEAQAAEREEQVQKEFEVLGLNGEQLQMVYDYLLKHKIGIGQPVNIDDYLTDEEKDYLQEYLDEIAQLKPVTEG